MNSSDISRFLRSLADAVDGLPDSELEALLQREGLKGIFGRSSKKRRATTGASQARVRDEAANLMDGLAKIGSREDAAVFLERLNANRSVLTTAARLRDVHIQKQDTNEVIRTKLIENVVGSRLDSAAIRGQ